MMTAKWKNTAAAVLAGLLLAAGNVQAAESAQASAAAAEASAPARMEGHEAASDEFDPVKNKRLLSLSENLRCLVCQNQTIADSNADLAIDLRRQVREQIAAGRTDEEIIRYMTDRYGDFVLYKPPFKATTVILWVGPVVLLLLVLGWYFATVKKHRRGNSETRRELTAREREEAEKLLGIRPSDSGKDPKEGR